MKKEKFYITTAIDYVNAPPHLGHALEKVQADVLARYYRLKEKEVFFLSGTDENSLKNVQSAKKEGISTKELVEKNASIFFRLKNALNLSYDDFLRTTQKRHIVGAQKLWSACQKDIYKKKYKGLYCVGCEEFYKERELLNGLCPEHKRKPELIEEENYFFSLSKYQEKLKNIIKKDKIKIIPSSRKNEVLSFIEEGLEDICISRSSQRAEGWGIDVPQDSSQKIWVWFDALANYLTGVGYGTDQKKFKKFWPPDLHIIGKGILRFHAVYWPAILLGAGISLPKTIFVHGYITIGGQKISKSLGNVIDPFELVKKYGSDSLRYFLLKHFPPYEDGDFSEDDLKKRYNSDLADGLGNFCLRIIKLAKILKTPQLPLKFDFYHQEFKKEIKKFESKYHLAIKNFRFNDALSFCWEIISFAQMILQKKEPWRPEKNQEKLMLDFLALLKKLSNLLEPFLPETSKKIIELVKTRKEIILFPKI